MPDLRNDLGNTSSWATAILALLLFLSCPVAFASETSTVTAGPPRTKPKPLSTEKPEFGPTPAGPGRSVQRMLLAPGCYVLAPGQVYAASAYCLDQDLPAPAWGTALAGQSGASDAVVQGPRGTVSLDAAVAQHLVRLESLGRGDYFHVAIRNLSGRRLGICVRSAAQIGATNSAASPDLTPIKPQFQKILPPLKQAKLGSASLVYGADDTTHADIQKKIWDEAKKLKDRNMRALDPLFGPETRSNNCFGEGSAPPPKEAVVVTRCRD